MALKLLVRLVAEIETAELEAAGEEEEDEAGVLLELLGGVELDELLQPATMRPAAHVIAANPIVLLYLLATACDA
jgi:ribosomal protein L12E/L44/L45/RPP1/RPP2